MSKQKVKEDFIVTAFFENMGGGVPNIYMGNDFHDASVESYIYFSRKMNCAPKEYDNYFRKMDDFYIENPDYYLEEAVREASKKTYSSKNNLCVIDVYPDYYDVTLDYEKGSRKEVGSAYARTIREACKDFEAIVEPYIYENIRYAFSGQLSQYESVEERMNILLESMPNEYREEMEAFAETISNGNHGFCEDGKLSYEEAMIVQMVPDALRESACSALSLWGDKTVSGDKITLRVLEWRLGSENQTGKIAAVTHMKNGKKSLTSIGMLGLLNILTAVNDDGVFAGILDVGTEKEEPFVCEGKTCYTYAIKYALEEFDNATDVGNYLVEKSGDFTWCHNVMITDKDSAYCAEDCVSEVAEKGEGFSILRDENTPIHEGLSWDNKDSLCVVNSFTSKGNQDGFSGSLSNMVRFQKYNDWVAAKEKFSLADIKEMITCEKGNQLLVENVRRAGTVHIVLVDYATGNIQVSFTGSEGVIDQPEFLDVGYF